MESGAVQDAQHEAGRLIAQAKQELEELPAGEARNLLATLADAVISRRF